MYDKQQNENKDIRDKLNVRLNLKYIQENFSSKMIEIINEIIGLSDRKCGCEDTSNPMFTKFIFYLTETFQIFMKDERMLYIGILMVIISIVFNFISAT